MMDKPNQNFNDIVKRIISAAMSDEIVCIVGEVGTGKRQAASAIHKASKWKEGRFVTINCMGTTHEELCLDLYGKVSPEGDLVRKGAVSMAEFGTLYLHEIHELPKSTQSSIVRLIETGSYRPLGSSNSVRSQTRIIISSSATLEMQVENGAFRQDLHHLVTPIVIHMPRLNDRIEDIPFLFRSVLYDLIGNYDREISEEAFERLKQHSFNGNLIELKNIALRILHNKPEGIIDFEDVEQAIIGTAYYDASNSKNHFKDYLAPSINPLTNQIEITSSKKLENHSAEAPATIAAPKDNDFQELNKPRLLSELVDLEQHDVVTSSTLEKTSEAPVIPSPVPAPKQTKPKAADPSGPRVLSLKEQEVAYFKQLIDEFSGDKQKISDAAGLNLRTLYRRLKQLGLD